MYANHAQNAEKKEYSPHGSHAPAVIGAIVPAGLSERQNTLLL